jgi:hypothetical protein
MVRRVGRNIQKEYERSASEPCISFSPAGRSGSAERIYRSIYVASFERLYCGMLILAHLISPFVFLVASNGIKEPSQHVQIRRPCPDFATSIRAIASPGIHMEVGSVIYYYY